MLLSEIIAQKIKERGPISFHDFMDIALYYPDLGYYTSGRNKIGVKGDFYTSSDLGSIFGSIIARQLEEMWNIMYKGPFTIVEYGAGNGILCHDILNALKANRELYDCLNYCIIEKSPSMRGREKMHLNEKVSWHNSIKEIAPVRGCIVSNELIDTFPVHRVVMKNELMEIFVDDKNGFVEVLQPASSALKNYLKELRIELPKDFCTEINLQATEWIKEIASSLNKGYVITVDYGYPSTELYSSYRSNGTLLCYHQHQINEAPYNNIGEQDITTHVNFSAIDHWGTKNGLQTCGFTNQAQFLLSLGFNDYANKDTPYDHTLLQRDALLRYTLLIDMGNIFKILIQSKQMPKYELSGLRHAPFSLKAYT